MHLNQQITATGYSFLLLQVTIKQGLIGTPAFFNIWAQLSVQESVVMCAENRIATL